jgi:hypothetical protein
LKPDTNSTSSVILGDELGNSHGAVRGKIR